MHLESDSAEPLYIQLAYIIREDIQNGKYNASTGEYTAFKGAKGKDDIDELNNRCNNLFTVSRMILDNNVYAEAFGDTHVTGK